MAKHDWCDYLPNAFRNLHKKAFNSVHYNVVCCQSLTHLARDVLSLSSTPGAEEANWNWIFKQPKGARRAPVGGCWLVKYSSNEISINIIKIHFVVVAVEVRVRRLLHCISSWFIHECESIKLTFLAGWKTGEMANGSALWSSSWLQCSHSESVALFKILLNVTPLPFLFIASSTHLAYIKRWDILLMYPRGGNISRRHIAAGETPKP